MGRRRRSRSSRASARIRSIGRVLDPAAFKAYDVRALYPSRARRGGRVRDRAGVRRAVRAAADRGRARHAAVLADDGRGGHRGRRRRGRRRRRPRDGRDGDGLLRDRRARARRRDHGHRVAQPEAVHGAEDRAARRAAGRERVGAVRGARPGRAGRVARGVARARSRRWTSGTAFVDAVLGFVDVSRDRGRCGSSSTPRTGWPGEMLPRVLERLPQVEVVRCYFEPDGSFPNHEPNPLLPENREFIVRRTLEEGAAFGVAYDGDADRCFFVDDTGEFVPGDFVTALFAQLMLGARARREGDLRRPGLLGGAADDRGGRRRAARSTGSGIRSSSSGCARRARSSPARCRRTTTSATSPRPTRA